MKATERQSIGYVGVGLMGLPMVTRLAGLGYRITCFDIDAARVAAASAAGARAATSARDAAHGVDVVALNLPTTDAVELAVFGPDGVAAAVRPPQLVLDFSTVDVARGTALAARLREATGCAWIDAPVSGGPPAAAAGTLTIMAGGDEPAISCISPLMNDVSARFTHMGSTGSGLVAKMINQLIVGCVHAVMAEAVVVARAAGVDAARIPGCLAGGHADGTLLQKLYPRMVARDFAPQGYARQLLKDLEMVNAYAGSLKVPLPMTAEALSLYRMLIHRGHAELDTSAIVKLYDRDASA